VSLHGENPEPGQFSRFDTADKASDNNYNLLGFEKPTVAQLVQKFRVFYGTRRFITVFTRAYH